MITTTRKKNLRPFLVGGAVGLAFAALSLSGALETWTLLASDRFFLSRPADPSIVVVAIDDASLGQIGRWPWPRRVHAQLIKNLADAGARVIGYDVNFPEPSDPENDAELERAIREAGNVVLPVELQIRQQKGELSFDPSVVVSPIPAIGAAAAATGHSNTPPDVDGTVRRVPIMVSARDRSVVPAFALQAFRIAAPGRDVPPRVLDRYGRLSINFNGQPRTIFPTISAVEIVRGTFDKGSVAGKTIFVGATAADLHDDRLVPTSLGLPMPGVEIHASLYDTLLTKRWIVQTPFWFGPVLILLLGMALGAVIPVIRARYSLLLTLGLWIGSLVTAIVLFDRGRVMDVVWPSLTLVFAYAAVTVERRMTADQERRELKTAFSRYVAPAVVDAIIEDPSRLKLGGEKRRMTVLFSDIRGFTTISESLSPETLVELMNAYLTAMTDIVFANGGTLDKYIGDAVMAFWNAPFDQPDHAARAAKTALEMQAKLAEMNRAKAFPNGIQLKIGVGINTGEMIVGNMGSETRFDYTVLGDNVNLGSRLESVTKDYGVGIILSEAAKKEAGSVFKTRKLDTVTVKGKTEPVVIYELLD
ncbi:adenylate/guanylate cyclase domain-containing protein [Candidatus Uhrbacteria bacterium]|nr:adenylate/guanylate cyclase domain-containing protein [Candidatus Uhrbacteria bacterium]